MRDILESVLRLQPEWSSTNTPAMQRRGELVRRGVAGWLSERVERINRTLPTPIDDLQVEARDATGLKSEIPWARVYSAGRSPSATKGWYLVYLFDAPGTKVYLSLMQGTTQWLNGEFRARPQADLRLQVDWVRNALAKELSVRFAEFDDIALRARKSQLGPAYEAGSVAAFEYTLDALPNETELESDLAYMLAVLSDLYERLDTAIDLPGAVAPEVADAVVVGDRAAGRRRSGQGLRLNAAERVAIERRAVELAVEHLNGLGYRVKDVGAIESYDLDARRGDEHLFVEVKGTTSTWGEDSEIILTRNEVELHQREYPNTMLVVVSSIQLDRSGDPPTAQGGILHAVHPWQLDPDRLIAITYRYPAGPDVTA
ncbi:MULTISPECIES: MrcB family domain-containing protein [unclassified Saccharothrix]|uniref:MrcB family domain-containing protein n=1 Tax=unclassified Saccharothrix TaxID=2593673 RepID=UPI00307D96EE